MPRREAPWRCFCTGWTSYPLEREPAEYSGPADAMGRAAVADRYGAARGRTLRRVQEGLGT